MILERWRKYLPKEKTKRELDEHYREMEKLELEKGDLPAMILGALIAFAPLLVILALIFLIPLLLFRVL